MDKYEFNIKVDQIKKLINKGDYETAMKIADGVDWRRVRNTNLLTLIAQVYEKNEEYQESKDILLLAFERAPIGKRLLYKLAELALKEGNVTEAEAYYKEFCDIAGDDPRQHLLRYLILKGKGASAEQLIQSLESYTSIELEEKWIYELAELYHKAGMQSQCVAVCDRIMLMFGLGKYVDKAMELKQEYAPLTGYQMDLVENRDKYEAKLRAVEQEFSEDAEPERFISEPEPITPTINEDEFVVKVREAEVEERLAAELSRMEAVTDFLPDEQEDELAHTRILTNIRDINLNYMSEDMMDEEPKEVTVEEETLEANPDMMFDDMDLDADYEPEEEIFYETNHFMIEAITPEKGLNLALETLKRVHKEQNTKHQIAKITGEKLNKKGLLASADMLEGKDLIIEQASSLSRVSLEELELLMEEDTSGINVILIDSPKRIESLHSQNISLAGKFDCIGTNEEPEFDVSYVSEALTKHVDEQVRMVKEISAPMQEAEEERVRRPRPVVKDAVRPTRPVVAPAPTAVRERTVREEPAQQTVKDDREMDLDEFAQFACKYATEIDCNISGKSMLALYERIEIMEEDGIPLTQENAEIMIEEAADRAEKPSIGKLIKGVFSSKYDKDGLLILKEEHFID